MTINPSLEKNEDEIIIPSQEDSANSIILSEEDSNDSVILSEEDSDGSTHKEPECKIANIDKSSMKSEMKECSVSAEITKEDDEYFLGPIGRFFLDMGLTLVQEYVHGDFLRALKRKAQEQLNIADLRLSVAALSRGNGFFKNWNFVGSQG